ncbi:MAG TPA: NAD(P)/FAD-dependent oxidoreductase [Oscillospiraceae bacterium]|nr:NAD(P)/FAD-dependent oxidoreductase [Oscillospiraceae bacterium]
MHYDAIIIGGGAAGMLAAVTAARNGRKVLIAERNDRLGKKLLITGKGRCNVTNNCDITTLMGNIPQNGRFLYSAFSQFSASDTMNFFENIGVPLKTERGNRVFPISDKAADIVNALEKELKKSGVKITTDRITSLIIEDGICKGVMSGKNPIYSESVLIATGGKSYPLTGSTGDGYEMAEKAGHTIIPIVPSLVPIETEENYCTEMMGLSLKNVTLSLKDTKTEKVIYSELGEMLFTHLGVSGPLVLSASSHIREMEQGRYKIFIDLKPALNEEKLDARLLRDFSEAQNKDFSNVLHKLIPSKMIPVMVKLSGIDGTAKVNQITKKQRSDLISVLKAFPLTIKRFRPVEEAIITSGGISVKEISPKTMESKLIKNLYFAGEIIDVDAYTGGFNLQIAFSTGYAAGMNI